MDFGNVSMEEFVQGRLRAAIMYHASVSIEMARDNDADAQGDLEKWYQDLSISQLISGIREGAIDHFVDGDTADGIMYDRDKLRGVAQLIALEPKMQAFLAVCALMLQGYEVTEDTHAMLKKHVGTNYNL